MNGGSGDGRGYGRELADLFALDPARTHLNLGAFGAVPRPVLAAKRSWVERAEADPHKFHRVEAPRAVARARLAAADWLGVDACALALISNVTEGASTVLASLDLRAGDEVVVSDHGYGAVRLALDSWGVHHGLVVREVPVPLGADDATVVAGFAAAVGPRTRLVIVDQITSPTARQFPAAEVAAAVRASGHPTLVLVDGAHAPGTLPTDVAGLGADIWLGNFHKWLFAPRGTAGLWLAPQLRGTVRPLVLGWATDAGYPESFDARGTQDLSGWMALPDALQLWAELGGWDMVARCERVVARGHDMLVEAVTGAGLEIDLSELPRQPAPTMRLLPLPDGVVVDQAGADAFCDRLSARGLEVAVVAWGGRGWLRPGAQAVTELDDFAHLAAELPSVLRESMAGALAPTR